MRIEARLCALLLSVCICPSVARAAAILVASSMTDGTVYEIDEAGQKTVLTTVAGSQPHEVEFNSMTGELFVAAVATDSIWRVSPSGVRTTLYTFPSIFDNPEGLALDLAGNVYASGTIGSADIFAPNQIVRITHAGNRTDYAIVGAQENLSAAMDSAANLFVTDLTNGGSVWKITAAQQVTELASNLGFATGLTIAPDGVSVLVSATHQNKIWKIAPDGTVSVYANIASPWALAFDPFGNLFVGQPTQISRIAPDGAQTTFTTGISEVRGIAYVPEPTGAIACAAVILLLPRIRKRPRA